jgi:hypothetical protein
MDWQNNSCQGGNGAMVSNFVPASSIDIWFSRLPHFRECMHGFARFSSVCVTFAHFRLFNVDHARVPLGVHRSQRMAILGRTPALLSHALRFNMRWKLSRSLNPSVLSLCLQKNSSQSTPLRREVSSQPVIFCQL